MTPGTFTAVDWIVVAAYLGAVVGLGLSWSRVQSGKGEFFLARRSIPMWAAALSVLATAQSAATILGVPEKSFTGDLTYLSGLLGSLIAVVIAARFFVPAYYRHGVTSIYELLGREFGPSSQGAASAMFMVGRALSDGARLYMAAIPLALVAFGHVAPAALIPSIVIIMIATAAYTLAGGIRAVIWTDVLQAGVYVGAVVVAVVLLLRWIPLGPGDLVEALRRTGDGAKLKVVDAAFDLTDREMLARPFNLWAVLLGLSLLNLAAFGTDQDLVQRMLTCRDAARGGWSLVVSYVMSWPVVALLLLVGLLLHVYYNRPDIMTGTGAAAGGAVTDSRDVFVKFIMERMPAGLRGLMVAGILAAAMSTLSSALNAMSSTTVADFYRRFAGGAGEAVARRELTVSRAAVAGWAAVLALVACFCAWWQQHSGLQLVDFALNVMVFAYSGMLAVFLAAIFTRRGNSRSAIAALVTGFSCVLLMQGAAWDTWAPQAWRGVRPAFGWQMLVATTAAFAVCCLGKRKAAGQ